MARTSNIYVRVEPNIKAHNDFENGKVYSMEEVESDLKREPGIWNIKRLLEDGIYFKWTNPQKLDLEI